MLLNQEVPYALAGPIGAEASTSFQVEDLHTLTNSFDDALFGCLEGGFQLRGPCKLVAWAQERLERCHSIMQLCVVCHLVDKAN